MEIRELAARTGVAAKTIRYYEDIELLSPAPRKPNGYRDYSERDVDRLRLVAGARRLDLSLAEIKELLHMRDRGEAPCNRLLQLLDQKRDEIQALIRELRQMEVELEKLYQLGLTFPTGQDHYALGCRVYPTSEDFKG